MRKSLVRSDKTFLIVGIFGVIFLAYFAFALPSVTFQPPTLSDNGIGKWNWMHRKYIIMESENNMRRC